jgi:hypothetical protein
VVGTVRSKITTSVREGPSARIWYLGRDGAARSWHPTAAKACERFWTVALVDAFVRLCDRRDAIGGFFEAPGQRRYYKQEAEKVPTIRVRSRNGRFTTDPPQRHYAAASVGRRCPGLVKPEKIGQVFPNHKLPERKRATAKCQDRRVNISELTTARVSRSGPKSLASWMERISASRPLARFTRLLIVPTAHPQI